MTGNAYLRAKSPGLADVFVKCGSLLVVLAAFNMSLRLYGGAGEESRQPAESEKLEQVGARSSAFHQPDSECLSADASSDFLDRASARCSARALRASVEQEISGGRLAGYP